MACSFTNHQIASEQNIQLSDKPTLAFQWQYVSVEPIKYHQICILTHWKHGNMQYDHLITKYWIVSEINITLLDMVILAVQLV